MEVETIKRQTRLRIQLVGHRSACGLRLGLRHIRPTPVSLWHEQRLCSCGMRIEALYQCYILLPLPTLLYMYI